MTNEYLTRQLDIIPLESLGVAINIVGAGATGSFIALCLAKMGIGDIKVWDFDEVSDVNVNCQLFGPKHIGKPKVEALQKIVASLSGTDIVPMGCRWTGQALTGIVIFAVDSMLVRRQLWNMARTTFGCKWIVDPRMGREYGLCYAMNPSDPLDVLSYERTLYSDEEAIEEPCTARATSYVSMMIAGYVTKIVKDLITNGKYARVSQWDIQMNHLHNWPKKEKLNAEITMAR